jgi:hypothetical protein
MSQLVGLTAGSNVAVHAGELKASLPDEPEASAPAAAHTAAQQQLPAAGHLAKLAPLQPGKYAFGGGQPSRDGIMAVHGRKPGMQIQPASSCSALLASSVPATPQSPCNASPTRPLPRKKAGLLPGAGQGGSQGTMAALEHAASEDGAASRVVLPELHTLSTHCSSQPGEEAQQPQLRRSQRRRACARQT